MSVSEVSTINLELGVFPIVGLPVMKDAVEETFNDELFKISSKWIKGSDKKPFPEIQDGFIKNNPTLAEIRRGIKENLFNQVRSSLYLISDHSYYS